MKTKCLFFSAISLGVLLVSCNSEIPEFKKHAADEACQVLSLYQELDKIPEDSLNSDEKIQAFEYKIGSLKSRISNLGLMVKECNCELKAVVEEAKKSCPEITQESLEKIIKEYHSSYMQ